MLYLLHICKTVIVKNTCSVLKTFNHEIAVKKNIVLRPSALTFISRYRIYVYCIVYRILDKLSDTTERQLLAFYIYGELVN